MSDPILSSMEVDELYRLIRQLREAKTAATARVARLEEALRPFSALAKPLHERMDDRRPIFAIEGSEITVFDLLRARAALGETGERR